MAKVRDLMATRLHTVGPDDTVGEAVALMAQNRVGSVLVMDGEKLLGIFTERDTVRAISQSHDAPRHPIHHRAMFPQQHLPVHDIHDSLFPACTGLLIYLLS